MRIFQWFFIFVPMYYALVDKSKFNELLANYYEITNRLEGKLDLFEVIGGGYVYSIGSTIFNLTSLAGGLDSFFKTKLIFKISRETFCA